MGHHHHQHHLPVGEHPLETVSSDARLVAAVAVNVLLTVAQIVGGLIAGSLALIADAVHNLNDAASLGIALIARRIARRPADRRRTFGYRRAEIIGALINLTALIMVGLYLIYESMVRFFQQQQVEGWIVILVAGIALAVDIATAILTYAMARESINIKAAFVHNVSDALASVGVIVAGTLILLYDWYVADLLAALAISSYILYQSIGMMRQAICILMQSVPADIHVTDVIDSMGRTACVLEAHHVHVWEMDEHHRALEAHIVVNSDDLGEIEKIKDEIRHVLAEDFNIHHSTLEFELPGETACGTEHQCKFAPRHRES